MKYKIYKHTSPSGKVYIGQSHLENLINRWRNGGKGYFRKNKFGNYQQPAMVNAINKYSWDTWNHEIIDECNTLEEADLLEIKYIKLYNSTNPNFGYNITSGGGGHNGQPMSDETKNKLSEAIKDKWKNDSEYREKIINSMKGRKMHENTKIALHNANLGRVLSLETRNKISKSNGTPVLLFSLDGDFIAEYQSSTKAAEAIGKTCTSITNQCKNITKKCGNYLFVYKDDYTLDPTIIDNKISNLSVKCKRGKPIILLSINDEFIKEWSSTAEAARELNIGITSINNCLKGLSKTCKNFKWKYKNAN